jgi:hypothetical protein
MNQQLVPPAVIIELGVERRPRVLVLAGYESEEARVWDWIRSQGDLRELVDKALELAAQAPAA